MKKHAALPVTARRRAVRPPQLSLTLTLLLIMGTDVPSVSLCSDLKFSGRPFSSIVSLRSQ